MKHIFEPLTEVCELCGITRMQAEDRQRYECSGAPWACQPSKQKRLATVK